DTAVTDVELVDGAAMIRTATRTFRVGQVVVAAGPWLSRLVDGLALETVRTPMTWFAARADAAAFDAPRFPPFVRALDGRLGIWGHGASAGHGVKIGAARDPRVRAVDPDAVERRISAADWELVAGLVARALPALEPTPVSAAACMITRTPDGQFLLGRPRGDARLVVAGGCCGHAFKHAAGIGELLAQLACGESPGVDVSFADPDRFL
ncbi:MAG: sarcosine oxidase, partial [Solirubrobacteraceae bacterium]|nr:sarcosine oxidase [Solirubrobacteraceae bacterium]